MKDRMDLKHILQKGTNLGEVTDWERSDVSGRCLSHVLYGNLGFYALCGHCTGTLCSLWRLRLWLRWYSTYTVSTQLWILSPAPHKTGMTVNVCNSSIEEWKEKDQKFEASTGFEASLHYMRLQEQVRI